MATNPKITRRWIKSEKRIVRLLYKKGLLSDWKIDDFYWEAYTPIKKRKYRRGKKQRRTIYYPEIHFSTSDYWGECDEHSVVDSVIQALYWENLVSDERTEDGSFPKSTFKIHKMDRQLLINYLKKLPTKISDNKIKKITRKLLAS